jgi:NitT/TauT family transport system substrate-binding protein
MSCVVVVRQDVIDRRPQAVQVLVDGIARSGLWLDEGRSHREHAADFVARYYYRQRPEVLRHALTEPLDRVIYTRLSPRKPDFDMVRDLMIETGVLDRRIASKSTTRVRRGPPTRRRGMNRAAATPNRRARVWPRLAVDATEIV